VDGVFIAAAFDFQLLDLLFFFLLLHTSVLEPNLDLSLRQAKGVRHLDPPPPRQVAVEMEFLLEFKGLVPRVSLSAPFPRRIHTWGKMMTIIRIPQLE
jgi:hypothetical protein